MARASGRLLFVVIVIFTPLFWPFLAARADFIEDIKEQSGTVYVLVSNQTPQGGGASTNADGVWRLKRTRPSDGSQPTDRDYRMLLLPNFPVNSARGLSVDKFGRVFVSDSAGSKSHDLLAEGASSTVNATVQVGGTNYNHNYETGYIAEIRSDGTVSYPGSALWANTGSVTEPQYTYAARTEVSTKSISIDGASVTAGSSILVDANSPYTKYVFQPKNNADYLPPPMHVLGPASRGLWHEQYSSSDVSLYTYGSETARFPFPTSGLNIPVSLNQAFINTNYTTLNSSSDYADPSLTGEAWHGWEVRNWSKCSFGVTPYSLFGYCDDYAVANLGCARILQQYGDSIYTSLSFSATSSIKNHCGDPCYTSAAPADVTGQSAEAKASFSTFGQDPASQNMYVAMQAAGQPSLRAFTLQGSTWNRETIAEGDYLKAGWEKFVVYRPGTTSKNFETLGSSAYNGQYEYLYLSSLPNTRFSVVSSFYRQGGIVYELNKDTSTISWEERIEGVSQQTGTVPSVPSGTQAITADGEDNVYMLRIERWPGGPDDSGQRARTKTEIYNSMAGNGKSPTPDVYRASRYYKGEVAASSSDYDVEVYFDRAVGLNVYKTNRYNSGDPTRIVLDDNGNPTVIDLAHETIIGRVKFDNAASPSKATWLTEPDGGALSGSSISSITNRFEIASINVALPPPVSTINTVDILYRGSLSSSSPPVTKSGGLKGDDKTQIVDVSENSDHFFGMENPPRFGGMGRQGLSAIDKTTVLNLGQSNIGSTSDVDGDSRIGRFSPSLIWGDETSYPEKKLQWGWTCENITFHDTLTGDTNPEVARGWKVVSKGTGVAAPTPGTLPLASTWFDATKNGQLVNEPWAQFRFFEPGRYRLRLYCRGFYWNISLGTPPSLNNPAYFFPDGFGGFTTTKSDGTQTTSDLNYGEMIINVKAKDFDGDRYVDSLSPRINADNRTAETVNQGAKPAFFCSGRIKWFRGYNIQSETTDLSKTFGAGVWNYSWKFGTGPNPPNVATNLPVGERNRNDADGDWGTRSNYDGVGENDMLPFAESDNSATAMSKILAAQQTHDWYEVKYSWELSYFDPTELGLGLELTDSQYKPAYTLKEGNFAELLVLHANRNSYDWWPSGYKAFGNGFVNYDGSSPRVYNFRLPLLYKGPVAGAKLTDILAPDSSSPLGKPQGSVSAQPITWNVPTDPTFVRLTCKIVFPKVKWVPVKEGASTLTDTAGRILYYNLTDDGTGDGQYLRSEKTVPVRGFDNPVPETVGAGSDNADDYAELKVLDTRDLTADNAVLTRNGVYDLGTGGSGQRTSADVCIPLRDNNPFSHFKAWNKVGANVAIPCLTQAFYEFGPNTGNNGGDRFGVGPLGTAHWGYQLHDEGYWKGSTPALDYPEDPDPSNGSRPVSSGFFVYAPQEKSELKDGLAGLGDNARGHSFPLTGFDVDGAPDKYVDLITVDSDPVARCDGTTDKAKVTRSGFCIDDFAGGVGNTCYRQVSYRFPRTEIFLPLFFDGTVPFLVTARDRVSTVAANVGRITIKDTVPPNLKVMILNEKTQQALYYIVEGYYGKYDSSFNVVSGVTEAGRFYVVKKSTDNRPDLNINNANYITNSPIGEPTGASFDFVEAGANWDGTFTTGPFRVEEDVRLLIKAFAVDNTVGNDMSVTIRQLTAGSPVALLEKSPTHHDTGNRESSVYARVLYPREGMSDTFVIQAADGRSGNATVTVRIPIQVVKNPAKFRRVGDQ